jgi:hypothetical protein
MKDPDTAMRNPRSEIRDPGFLGQASHLSPSSRFCDLSAKRLRKQRNLPLTRVNQVGDRRDACPTEWLRRFWLTVLWCSVTTAIAATNSESENEILKLNPPYAELPPTFWEQYGTWMVFGAVLLLVLVGLAVWWVLRPKPSIPVPIDILTRKELEALRQRPEDGQVLSQVSRVLRRYVVGAFALPPDELTTSEFCQVIASHEKIGPDLATRISEFLHQCDELKFAPAILTSPMSAAARAMELVELGEARRAHLRNLETAAVSSQPAQRG